MAKLIYSAITSLDGYVADEDGNFDWAAPDEEVHTFVNDLERPVGTYLYGRRMYEMMVYWETAHTARRPAAGRHGTSREIWQAADKIVYSRTLETVSSARTRIERDFDPEAVRQLKAAAGRDISVGGPDLAAPGDQGRAGRRVPAVRRARRGGRRQPVPPRRCPRAARAAGRTPVRQRRGLPPLPHQDVRRPQPLSGVGDEPGPGLGVLALVLFDVQPAQHTLEPIATPLRRPVSTHRWTR